MTGDKPAPGSRAPASPSQRAITRRQVLGLGSLPVAAALAGGCGGTTKARDAGKYEWRFRIASPLYTGIDATASQVCLSGRSGLVALDTGTGKEMWRFPSHGKYPNVPVIGAHATYVISGDNSRLYAVSNASGHQMWTLTVSGCVLDGLLVDGAVAYVGADRIPNGGTQLFALDAQTGGKLWSNSGDGTALLITGDALYVDSGLLRVLAKDSGRELWAFAPSGIIRGKPTISGDTCYVICDADDLGSGNLMRVNALDQATGAAKWAVDIPGGPPVSLQVTPDFVYAAADTIGAVKQPNGNVIAADARTGAIAWTTTVPNLGTGTLLAGNSLLVSGTPPATDGGIVSAGGASGETEVCALDLSTGKPKWRSAGPGGWITDTPLRAGNTIIAGFYSQSVRAIDLQTGKTTWSKPLKVLSTGPITTDGSLLVVAADHIGANGEGQVGGTGALYALSL